MKMECSLILRFNNSNVRHNFAKDSNRRCYSLPAGFNTEQHSNYQIDIEMEKLGSSIRILCYVLCVLCYTDMTHVIDCIHINIFSCENLCNQIMEVAWIYSYP